MNDSEEDKVFPVSDPRNFGRKVAIGAVGAIDALIPMLGYAVQQILDGVVPNPLQKRQEAFINKLASEIDLLSRQLENFDPASLVTNDDFITAVAEIVPLAIKTNREEKRQRFVNAVLNVASGKTVADALRGRFIRLLDQFSDDHVLVLQILANPTGYPLLTPGNVLIQGVALDVVQRHLDSIGMLKSIQTVVYEDLQQERLVKGNSNTLGGGASMSSKNTTDLGDAFLSFLTSPLN